MVADLEPARAVALHARPDGMAIGPLGSDAAGIAEAAAAATLPGHVDHGIWLGVDRVEYWRQLLHGEGPCGRVLAEPSRLVRAPGGAIAAAAVVTAMPATDWWQGDPWIPEIFVVAGFQGRGVGGLLLEHALGACARSGSQRVGLTVSDGNPAGRLYERFGFRAFRSTWFIARSLWE